jgi:hypothetical protein
MFVTAAVTFDLRLAATLFIFAFSQAIIPAGILDGGLVVVVVNGRVVVDGRVVVVDGRVVVVAGRVVVAGLVVVVDGCVLVLVDEVSVIVDVDESFDELDEELTDVIPIRPVVGGGVDSPEGALANNEELAGLNISSIRGK